MKNFLAVDTSGNHLSVVACKEGQTYSVFLPDCAMRHAVSIMPAIEECLQKADMKLAECDFFAAVVGAGSFTGIRIGISTIKGFCLAFHKPALPVTSFDVIAYNEEKGKTLALVDALHDSYYACGYEEGNVSFSPAYLSEEEVLALAENGYTMSAFTDLALMEKAHVNKVDPCVGLERAVKKLAKQNAFGELTALYVRKSSAELNLGKTI